MELVRLNSPPLIQHPTKEIFMAKYGSLVEVAPTNIHVDVPGSMVHIKKATLKPEAFEDLHLPLTLSGGNGNLPPGTPDGI